MKSTTAKVRIATKGWFSIVVRQEVVLKKVCCEGYDDTHTKCVSLHSTNHKHIHNVKIASDKIYPDISISLTYSKYR